MRLCKKVFYGASRRIMFCETHHFPDFASRNQENDVSHKIIFCRRRRQKTFYTTPQKNILPPKAARDFSHNPRYLKGDLNKK